MGLELDVYALTRDELEKAIIRNKPHDLISQMVKKPIKVFELCSIEDIELPKDSLYYRKRHSNIVNYMRTRFSVKDLITSYIGRARFIHNKIVKDLKRLENNKPLKCDELSVQNNYWEFYKLDDLYDCKTDPTTWQEFIDDLADLKQKLSGLMKEGEGDSYVIAFWIT